MQPQFNLSRNHIVALAISGILVLGLVLAAFVIRATPIVISSPSSTSTGALLNAINVSGEGKIFVTPDKATLYVGVSETANTTADAISAANKKANEIRDLALAAGVKADKIQTTSFNLSPEYDYATGGRTLRGQTASQTVQIIMTGLDAEASSAAKLIDQIAKINNVILSSIAFDKDDRASAVSQARTLAVADAGKQAGALAAAAGVELLKPISISETSTKSTPPIYATGAAVESRDAANPSTQLSSGQLEITVNVSVVYGIK